MKHKIGHRITAILLVAVILLGLIPSVAFAAESGESASIPPPVQSGSDEGSVLGEEPILEPEQAFVEEDDSWDFDDDWDGPRSDDGAPLTRNQIMMFAVAGSSATVGKSTCVEFPQYTSPYWYCNRYYTDGTHKYGHYFYASAISYHTVDGEYAYCVEPNTSSINGAAYTSYAGNSANSTTYWMYELDATQRSNIQKILAFGYPN